MNDYLSLIIGTAYGLVLFVATLLWIIRKEKKAANRRVTNQEYLDIPGRPAEVTRIPAVHR